MELTITIFVCAVLAKIAFEYAQAKKMQKAIAFVEKTMPKTALEIDLEANKN